MENSRKKNAFLGVTILSLVAIADGLYLTFLHFRHAVGAGSKSGICDALSSSGCEIALGEAGLFLGVPIAIIGLAGAVALFLLALHAFWVDFRVGKETSPAANVVWLLALVSVIASLGMAGVSLREGHFCPMCVIWYFLNVSMLVVAHQGLGGTFVTRGRAALQSAFGTYGFLGAAAFAVVLGGLFIWYSQTLLQIQERQEAQLDELRLKVKSEIHSTTKQSIPVYENVPKKQSVANEEPVLRIVEFSDIECPFCRRLWENIDVFVEETKVAVSVEFVHYPLNRECNSRVQSLLHPDACHAAFASICAQEQNDFWGYTKAAFQQQESLGREDLIDLATARGLDVSVFKTCLDAPATMNRLSEDIKRAGALDVKGTPTVYVNGVKMSGALSPEIFHMITEEVLTPRP